MIINERNIAAEEPVPMLYSQVDTFTVTKTHKEARIAGPRLVLIWIAAVLISWGLVVGLGYAGWKAISLLLIEFAIG